MTMTPRFEGAASTPQITSEHPVLVLGGGPAGLTAGYLLAKAGKPVVVVEAEDQLGGLAKTVVDPEGYRFDLGGHRFFTKAKEVDDLWHEIMGDEFLQRPRQSRIFWNGKFLDYPLNGTDVIKKLGPIELTRAGLSYLYAAIFKRNSPEENLEQWVSKRFGWRLYSLFFKSYNEKVWGVPTTEIRAEWAAQRIKGLSFFSAAKAAFLGNKGNKIKSLIDKFNYPRYGPGQMWDTMSTKIRELGGQVLTESPVTKLVVDGAHIVEVEAGGVSYKPSAVISSLPLRATVGLTQPAPPAPGPEAPQAPPAPPRPPPSVRPRRACATATSSPSPSCSTARTSSPTTGSTSTSRTSRSGASRTTARGVRGWSPTRRPPASASSTSASAATSCGR